MELLVYSSQELDLERLHQLYAVHSVSASALSPWDCRLCVESFWVVQVSYQERVERALCLEKGAPFLGQGGEGLICLVRQVFCFCLVLGEEVWTPWIHHLFYLQEREHIVD